MTALRSRLVPTLALLLVLGTSACSALAPSIPTGTPQAGLAAAGASTQATTGASTQASPTPTPTPTPKVSATAQASTRQLGIQVYWHTSGTTEQVESAAAKVLDYVVGLGANSVALTFPIYTDGVRPTKIYGVSGSTPTPATLDLVIKAAQARGLRVMVRPLIDETNIKDDSGDWRGSIKPVSVSGWFASYRSSITPYLRLAQQDAVDYFDLGVELDSLESYQSDWTSLDSYAAGIYRGELDYGDNWSTWQEGGPDKPAAHVGVDAYPDVDLSDDASVAELTNAWEEWLEHRSAAVLQNTVMQEVGIPASSGAYHHPAQWATAGATPVTSIQVHWFTAACDAAQSLGLPGIYFWDVDSYAEPSLGATSDTGSFIGRGDQAIKSCFASGWGN
ncbi:hypothetical protein KDL01_11695 [Actinospica durhamensis]|uniref:Uncharacterized protein n=1 Tax=Actinospica durhamensis TaxID=1508375 RepID=A0A941ERT5_9ACTN|nr:hypothetical protein [Actinospica durhamensis]MBR7833934.1 hypothetical protein [Actinospica durhamensis]